MNNQDVLDRIEKAKEKFKGIDMNEDKQEWVETFELMKVGNETISSELSFGNFVTIKKELFEKIIEEINDFRIKAGDLEEGVDLIVLSEEDDENIENDS